MEGEVFSPQELDIIGALQASNIKWKPDVDHFLGSADLAFHSPLEAADYYLQDIFSVNAPFYKGYSSGGSSINKVESLVLGHSTFMVCCLLFSQNMPSSLKYYRK